jgi:hypothetical protein
MAFRQGLVHGRHGDLIGQYRVRVPVDDDHGFRCNVIKDSVAT